ncbi:hypothetical protein DAMA08_043590 [Martiniozyma asiatica (nom. inval.)]|nr:hypothetical protein DAMA08_043590 [Martiniozyma asiatica]
MVVLYQERYLEYYQLFKQLNFIWSNEKERIPTYLDQWNEMVHSCHGYQNDLELMRWEIFRFSVWIEQNVIDSGQIPAEFWKFRQINTNYKGKRATPVQHGEAGQIDIQHPPAGFIKKV